MHNDARFFIRCPRGLLDKFNETVPAGVRTEMFRNLMRKVIEEVDPFNKELLNDILYGRYSFRKIRHIDEPMERFLKEEI